MDELSEKLAGILNDPDSMERVRRMAASLLGGEEQQPPPPPPPEQSGAGLLSAPGSGAPDAEELKRMIGVFSRFKNTGNDARAQLLLALRPHLSEPRREKVDTAIKILRLIDMLPYLRESGILNL